MKKNIINICLALSFLGSTFTLKAQEEMITNRSTDNTDGSAMAISTVSGDNLLKRPSLNPANSLYGQLNGLTVIQNGGYSTTGEAGPTLYIRGIGTINDNSALILIDGLERPINSLVTEEIEDIKILKDAASQAVYGLRGANGVVLITTKRGSEKKTEINISYQHTFLTPTRLPKFIDAATYAEAYNEGLTNEGLPTRYSKQDIAAYRSGQYAYLYPNVDWFKETLRDWGQRDQINFTAQGGSSKVRYFSLLNYASDRGLIKEADLNSYSTQLTNTTMNIRTNLDIELTSTTQMNVNLLGRLQEINQPGNNGSNSLIPIIYQLPANAYPVKTENDIWGGGSSIYPLNPVAESSSTGYSRMHSRGLYADLTLKQDLSQWIEGLSAKIRIGFDAFSTNKDTRTKQYLYESNTASMDESGIPGDITTTQYGKIETELGYSSALSSQSRHSNINLGFDYEKGFSNGNLNATLMYKQDKRVELGQFNSFIHQDIIAYAHYTLKNRYFFDLALSASGTSRLPQNNRWGFFPAVAAAWNIAGEDFLSQANWLNLLNLRASYGLTGNDMITANQDQYPFVSGNSFVFNNDFKNMTGMQEGHLPSTGVTFEKACKLNIGLDTRFFDLLTFNIDAFYNRTYDIMVNTQNITSSMLGAINAYEPDGVVKNYGIETGVSIGQETKNFRYNIGGQFSFTRNEIVEMDEGNQPYNYLKRTGRRVGQIFGLQSIGFFKDANDIENSPVQTFSTVYPGDIKYKDQNNDGRIDQYDEIAIGYNQLCPEIYYSFSINLEYKGLGLSALFQGVGNYSIIKNTTGLYLPLINNTNLSNHYLENCWHPGHEEAIYPRLTTTESKNNYRNNTTFVDKASYLKLRSAELYYKLPKTWTGKCRIQQFKLFVRGTDLFSIDNIKEVDPESIYAQYPIQKSYNIGFSATF